MCQVESKNFGFSRVSKMSSYVKLTSSEGAEFFVHRDCANVSQTIGAMLSGEYLKRRCYFFLLFFLCFPSNHLFRFWLHNSEKKEKRTEGKQNIYIKHMSCFNQHVTIILFLLFLSVADHFFFSCFCYFFFHT